MKEEKNGLLLDIALRTIRTDKTYEELVQDGAAMERLLNNKDFQRYQKLLAEHFIQLALRVRLVQVTELPVIQGAMAQMDLIMKMPEKVLEVASNQVAQQRERVEVS